MPEISRIQNCTALKSLTVFTNGNGELKLDTLKNLRYLKIIQTNEILTSLTSLRGWLTTKVSNAKLLTYDIEVKKVVADLFDLSFVFANVDVKNIKVRVKTIMLSKKFGGLKVDQYLMRFFQESDTTFEMKRAILPPGMKVPFILSLRNAGKSKKTNLICFKGSILRPDLKYT